MTVPDAAPTTPEAPRPAPHVDPRTPEKLHKTRQRVVIGVVVALVLFAILLSILNWPKVEAALADAQPEPLLWATGYSLLSMAAMSLAFGILARVFSVHLPVRDLSEIGFVSLAFGRVISSTGLPGYVLRLLLASRQGAETHHMLAASLFHSMANDLVLFALLPFGVSYLLLHQALDPWQLAAFVAVGVLALALTAVWASVMIVTRARRRILHAIERVWLRLTRRDIGQVLTELDDSMAEGTDVLRRKPHWLVLPFLLILIDWAAAIATLHYCFQALGEDLALGVLIAGFAVSMSAGFVSQLPGGIGVLEGSMAGMYALFGVSLEHAALAALVYRVVYYLVPFVVSLAFYWRLLRRPYMPPRQDGPRKLLRRLADKLRPHA